MSDNTPKRKIRDSVFTDLFQDKKYLFQLYQALHPEDGEATKDEIADITIKHVLVDADYNDLGFSVGDRLMVLVESQSTWTMNIIIRALMYLMQTYHDYFRRTKQNLYGSKKVKMPKPELYVIFTGERKTIPDIITLSKDFLMEPELPLMRKSKSYIRRMKGILSGSILFSVKYIRNGENAAAIPERQSRKQSVSARSGMY